MFKRAALTLLLLLMMVYFAFPIKRAIPIGLQNIYLLVFLCLYIRFTVQLSKAVYTLTEYQGVNFLITAILFVGVTASLYALSSCHRQAEAQAFLNRHRATLEEIVRLGEAGGRKVLMHSRAWSLNMRLRGYDNPGEYHFVLTV